MHSMSVSGPSPHFAASLNLVVIGGTGIAVLAILRAASTTLHISGVGSPRGYELKMLFDSTINFYSRALDCDKLPIWAKLNISGGCSTIRMT